MRQLSLAFRLVLALCVALVSVHTAIGRAEAAGASEIQFCIGTDIVTVTLDAKGDPVKRGHTCPDCVLSGLAVLHIESRPTLPRTRAQRLDSPAPTRSVTPARLPQKAARGPPVLCQA